MKIKKALLLTFTAVVMPMLAVSLQAQVEGPPEFVDYQGVVFNSTTAAPMGSTGTVGNYVANPTNYTIHFKIFDTASGGNLIWAETQTVTVSLGSFAVRLGTGAKIATLPVPASELSIKDAFNGKERFLELTVFPPSNQAVGSVIVPRLAFQTSPFSFVAGRAKVAESVAAFAISSGMLANGAVGSTQLGTAAVGAANIDSNAVDNTKLRNSAGLSVIGRTSNSSGDPADIVAASDGQVLRRSGSTVGFGTVGTAGIANASITGEKIASGSDITCSQLSAINRVLTTSLEFGNVWDLGGALWQQSDYTLPTNTGAADGEMVLMGSPKLHLATANAGSSVMTLSGANVGIGTTTPTQARLVVLGSATGNANTGSFYVHEGQQGLVRATARIPDFPASIFADGNIWTGEYFVSSSDARIKNIQGRSDSSRDLDTLVQIEVTDYRYKDVIGKGNFTQKKVIAQQVEKFYPQAVSNQTDVVPDIYKQAPTKDGWVELATDLKKGERVKLITGKGEGSVHEVLEVTKDKFLTDFRPEGNQVFVYGREVNDFRTVDYDAIAMLNVSATQQIKKEKDAEVKALYVEIELLRAQLAKQATQVTLLEAKDEARDTKLKAIEQLLSSSDLKVKRTVSQNVAESSH
jgi:hypothetical protein